MNDRFLFRRSCPGVRVAVLAAALIAFRPQPGVGEPRGGGKKKPADIPVTTTIGDLDSNGLPVTFASDGLGPYHHNQDGVLSYLPANAANGQTNGDWFFVLYDSPNRTYNETFREEDAVPPGDPNYTVPPSPYFWGSQLVPGQLKIKCSNVNKSMIGMAAGSTITCPLLNTWYDDVTGYVWGPNPAHSLNGFPEVTDIQVSCNTVGSDGLCNDWFVDPINLGQAVARLIEDVQVHNRDTKVNHGDFYMRFHVHITRP